MPAIDKFQDMRGTASDPVTDAASVTLDQEMTYVTSAIWVSVEGSVTVTMQSGSVVTYPKLLAGRHPLRITQVHSVGTDATGIVAEWNAPLV